MEQSSIFLLKKFMLKRISKTKMKKNKNTRKTKKMWGALALGMLLLSGGAFALPLTDSNFVPHSENFKMIKDNPSDFLKTNNIELRTNFDYFEEINREFTGKNSNKSLSKNNFGKEQNNIVNVAAEKALLKAIEEENYTEWKNAVTLLEGYPEGVGVISEDDFKILVKVHKDRKDL